MLLYCFINACTCGSIKIYKLGLIKVRKQRGELAASTWRMPLHILLSLCVRVTGSEWLLESQLGTGAGEGSVFSGHLVTYSPLFLR